MGQKFVVEAEVGGVGSASHLLDDIVDKHLGAEALADVLADFAVVIEAGNPVPEGLFPLVPNLPHAPRVEAGVADVLGPGFKGRELPLASGAGGVALGSHQLGIDRHLLGVDCLVAAMMHRQDSGVAMARHVEAGMSPDTGGRADGLA